MKDLAIKTRNLGKKYRIHKTQPGYRNLREDLVRLITRQKNTSQDFWALKSLDLEVGFGETVGIVGSNGSGKSTLLKLLSRVTWPTTGEIELSGHVGSLLEVGTGFHLELTGRENIFLCGAILGMHKEEVLKHFDKIIAFSGVESFLDEPVKRYSSGMFLRLAFSVMAHLKSEILIVDEVIAVGDKAFQEKCIDKIKKMTQEGRTVLFVSHNLVALRSLCERIIWLDKGQLAADGPAGEVLDAYISSFKSSVNAMV